MTATATPKKPKREIVDAWTRLLGACIAEPALIPSYSQRLDACECEPVKIAARAIVSLHIEGKLNFEALDTTIDDSKLSKALDKARANAKKKGDAIGDYAARAAKTLGFEPGDEGGEEDPSPEKLQLRAIRDIAAEVEILKGEWLDLKERASDAKKAYEAKQGELLNGIKTRQLQPILPFAQPDPSGTVPAAGSEAWRKVSIDELGLGTRAHKALTNADLKTIGAIADLTSDGKPLTAVKGVGEGSAEEIEKSLERFWKDHPIGKATTKPVAAEKPKEPTEDEKDRKAGTHKLRKVEDPKPAADAKPASDKPADTKAEAKDEDGDDDKESE